MTQAQGKPIAIVTGGAGGIGREIVQALVKKDCRVLIVDISSEGQKLSDQLNEEGFTTTFIQTDVTSPEDVRKVANYVSAKFGRLDWLVNNVGLLSTYSNQPIEELPIETFDRVLSINLRSAFLFTKFTVPLLRVSNIAAIVNMSSTKALMSMPNNEAYSTSKAGLLGLTIALANSLGPQVRVNAICPGFILPEGKRSPEFPRPIDHSQHLVGRVGLPQDVANMTCFLLSQEASFITGQAFVVDGGMACKMSYAI